jgi:hypothetical protein
MVIFLLMSKITDGKTGDNKEDYDIPLLKKSVVVVDSFYN